MPLEAVDLRRPNAEDWGRILFTSGTTGLPKGVVHTHGGRWLANSSLRLALPVRPGMDDRILLMTPFAHGTSLLAYAFLYSGAAIYLMDGVRPVEALELIASKQVNHVFAPPTVLRKLVDAANSVYVGTLRTVFTGTSTLSSRLYEDARKVFGPVIRVTYGMTEIFNPITVLEQWETGIAYRSGDSRSGACLGWPPPGVEISVRDDAGDEVPIGQIGEIHVYAPHMFTGYITSQGFQCRATGRFHPTGDLGHYTPDTGLHLVGRKHDVIKTGGYKVFPFEVEKILCSEDSTPNLVIFGLPSPYWGEVIIAVAEDPPPGWEIPVRNAASRLSHYTRPRAYVGVPALPRNAVGKIDRNRLREQILTHYHLIDGRYPRLELNPSAR